MNSRDKQLSKSLSWLLRHGAEKEGLELSEEGYIDIAKVLAHKAFKQYNSLDIERVVKNNDKQRFRLRINPNNPTVEIKACQGHSISKITDIELTRILEPKYALVHGTYRHCWPQIRQSGLSRMRRRHIHLAKVTEVTEPVTSGLRVNAQIHIFVNLTKALEDGIQFYESENGVVLTPGNDKGFLEPKYFDRVVEVASGYPPYTKPQDLAHAFGKFGSVRFNHEWISDAEAYLEFGEPEAAAAALQAGAKRALTLYGVFLSARPATTHTRPRRLHRKREQRLTHHKGTSVDPAHIPLEGDFSQQLAALLGAVRLSSAEVARLHTLYRDVELALGDLWPGCRAIPFGSVTTGLGVKCSDADCFVSVPRFVPGGPPGAVPRARRALQQHPRAFADLLAIPRANTPIIKLRHLPTGVYCDLSFKTVLGARNSALVAFLLFSDPRLVPVAVVIKYWARVHDLTGTGKLTNYALTMLVVFYLQSLGILPSVAWLQREADEYIVDHWNTGFVDDPRRLPPVTNTASVAELLGGFFRFYSEFDFERLVVCPYLGRPIEKDRFRDLNLLPAEFDRYKTNVASGVAMPLRFMTCVCVQDPFEQGHNVASPVSARLAADFRAYFTFAAAAHAASAPACVTLLRTILLTKPQLPRKQRKTTFRVRLPHGIVSKITAPDWKTVVRTVTRRIFDALRLPLKRVSDEREAGASGKGKDKHEGALSRAIWKRKQLSKLHRLMGRKFLDRETQITDEILNTDRNVIDVRFQLWLTFSETPRAAAVSLRHVDGDLNYYRDFGKFFNSIFQHWFVVLYRPHCGSEGTEDVATDEEAAAEELEVIRRNCAEESDSDGDTDSLEDERIDPHANADGAPDDEVQNDEDENDKNETNGVQRCSENDKTKELETETHDENRNPSPADQNDTSEPKLSVKSPRKSKNKLDDKNKIKLKIDNTKSPRRGKRRGKLASAADADNLNQPPALT